MNIRTANLEDAFEIARIHVRSWQAAYADILAAEFLSRLSIADRTQRWRDILQKNASQTLVAHRNDDVVGFVSFGHWRTEGAEKSQGEIWALYAAPEVWGQGVGKALLMQALSGLRALGRNDVLLWVLSKNHRGINFYRAFGFISVPGSEKVLDMGGLEVEEVCYRLRNDA
jgi:ribosomal protein S18 acetylase RimI-like enzyme